MSQSVLNQGFRGPVTRFRGAEFGDADMMPARDVAGFGLRGQPRCTNGDISLWAVGVSQDHLVYWPAGVQEGSLHQRFKVDALGRQVRIDDVVRGNPFAEFGIEHSVKENTTCRHPWLPASQSSLTPGHLAHIPGTGQS